MTRIISYDTENSDDILWALKRVTDDAVNKVKSSGDILKQLTDKIFESYKSE